MSFGIMGVFFCFSPILPDEMDDLVSRHPLSFAVVIFILFCPHTFVLFDASLLRHHRRLEKIMVLVFVAHQRAARKKKKKKKTKKTKTTKEEEEEDDER